MVFLFLNYPLVYTLIVLLHSPDNTLPNVLTVTCSACSVFKQCGCCHYFFKCLNTYVSYAKFATKEYILVIERTAPPQRLPNICPRNLSQPALSDGQVVGVCYLVYSMNTTDRAGRGCVGTCLENAAGCCAFYH